MTSFSLWNPSWRWILLIYGPTYPEDMFSSTFHAINLTKARAATETLNPPHILGPLKKNPVKI